QAGDDPLPARADDLDLVDVHGKRVSGLGGLHVGRTGQRVALGDVEVAQAIPVLDVVLPEGPAGLDEDQLPGLDVSAGRGAVGVLEDEALARYPVQGHLLAGESRG